MRVRVRGLAWTITGIEALGPQHLLHLRGDGGDLDGCTWQVVHPAEPVHELHDAFRPQAPGTLAVWRLRHLAALLEQLGPGSWHAAEPGRLHVEPYQVVPLMRALELPRVRLLLADGVGLGKTIQAGLILTELIARRQAHRVLIITPSGPLLAQWNQEMRQRFGLRFARATDAAALRAERRRRELGANPFDGLPLCLTSLDFAKQEQVLEELERAHWDLAIIDEAHHCVSHGPGAGTAATERRRLAEVIARQSDALLLLTATPHDGNDARFASLMALLDPSLTDGGGTLIGQHYRRHVVRRLKSHIRDPATGAQLFHDRRVIPVRVDLALPALQPVREFHRALAALVIPRLRSPEGVVADALAFIGLLKRSVSTLAACLTTLRVVAERCARAPDPPALARERARALAAWQRRLQRFGFLDPAAEADLAEQEADGIAAQLCGPDPTLAALDALITLGRHAEPYDPKLTALLAELRTIRAARPRANVLIYTEYADSQRAAITALRGASDVEGEVLGISGADPEDERVRVAERCADADGVILVSTDSMAEGLNLHRRCRDLIHLDLPYNPNRLEQRNGRIDRYGQPHPPQIRYLYLAGTFEEHLLLRLIARHERARARLGTMPDTLGATADPPRAGLVAGFAEEQATLFGPKEPAIRTLDRAAEDLRSAPYRELLREIDRAYDERAALRHGWMPDQGALPAPKLERIPYGIDLPAFVAAAVAADRDTPAGAPDTLALSMPWRAGLEELPGFDASAGIVRITRDPDRLHDGHGTLAFLGRAHPLVRRALATARRGGEIGADPRVAVARGNGGPALLLTYSAEIRGGQRVEHRQVIAIMLPRCGKPRVLADPAEWLRHAATNPTVPSDGVWDAAFAGWAPGREQTARDTAEAAARCIAAELEAVHRPRITAARAALKRWIERRARELCGAPAAAMPDLFGGRPAAPDWQRNAPPLERLAAFAADPAATAAARREAAGVVHLARERLAEVDRHAVLAPPALTPLGMLMLIGA